ncbi:hypothetical protein BN946_scf185016.g62 [Trametes cinnabarina]|uniref:Scavenger mRNA-decapping enzyme DcpS n=1 Tax=Pycnoporus cinnabarinus TaxID=5643 RepID=A0A060SHP1_PYCCI|nr:hypothetical protein BN946_scf185016.g62 [Trametes cinnabarina]
MPTYDIVSLRQFRFERVLNEDPLTHALTLLGTLPVDGTSDARAPAVVRIEKTALTSDNAEQLVSQHLKDTKLLDNTDIYTWLLGWLNPSNERPDVKINIVHPATEVHIRKYSRQEVAIVHETPQLFQRIVKPYIAAFPPSRTQWVENILNGVSEVEKVLFRDPSPEHGYLILPDMKWDLATVSSLYLVAIAFNRNIRSLRDLNKSHLGMLKSIRREAARVAKERWGLGHGSLRMFIHYQPSYYIALTSTQIECDPDEGPSILERMTFTYALGEQHGLYAPMKAAQDELGFY